jgi:ligand-binding sensor domain-containing protein/two-component sensor histidine kinase
MIGMHISNYTFRNLGLVLLLALLLKGLKAQEPYYYSIGEDAGFPVQQIYEIYQDKKGHLWIGCNGGLFEYDGNGFIQYQTPAQNSGSISNIVEDSQGRIWSRNFRGQVFHTQNGKLVPYINWADSIHQFPNLFIDAQDRLFLTSRKGIYRQDLATQNWTLITPKDIAYLQGLAFQTAGFFANQQGEPNIVTVSSVAGVIRADSISFFTNKTPQNKPDIFLRTFICNNKNYIIDAHNVLFELTSDSYSFVTDLSQWGLSKHSVLWITDLTDDKIAFGTRDGLFLFNYQFEPLNIKPYFKDKKVSCVLKDREGNIWVTTLQDGLFMIPDIEVMLYNKLNADLPENSIYSVEASPKGDLYLGFAKGTLGRLKIDGTFNELYNPAIRSEIPDINYTSHNNCTYFINWSKLLSLDEKGRVTEFSVHVSAPKEVKFFGNNLLIPTNSGIIWLMPGQKSDSYFERLNILPDQEQMLEGAILPNQNSRIPTKELIIRKLKKANSVELDTIYNRLWGIFSDGVYWFKDRKSEKLLLDSTPVYGNKMVSTTDSLLWMATSKGILAFRDTSLILTIPSPNSVLDLLVTDSLIWYATIKGIFQFNKTNHEMAKIDKFDGIASLEIHDIHLFNNTLYLATPKGLVTLPAFRSYHNLVPPVMELSRVSVLDRDTLILPQYKLSYHQNIITIYFNAISFKSKGTHQFKYRMVGLNDTWITVPGYQNVVRFISIPPGNFTFEVKALNEDGTESRETKTIQFTITPPFWKTLWFLALVILLSGTLVVIYFKIRIKNLTKRNQLEKLLKASEITAIKAQMNPHFIFNALNSIQDLILQNDLRASSLYLGRFSELLRQVLEMSGKETVSLQEEIRILEVYLELEKLRFSDNFNYQMVIETLPADRSQIYIPSMIIQPYLENAVKHGLLHRNGDKLLTVHFKADSTHLKCSISDNGVGRAKAEEIKQRRSHFHKSFASAATKKRIDLFNQLNDSRIELVIEDLYDEKTAIGTRVEISFPLHLIQ